MEPVRVSLTNFNQIFNPNDVSVWYESNNRALGTALLRRCKAAASSPSRARSGTIYSTALTVMTSLVLLVRRARRPGCEEPHFPPSAEPAYCHHEHRM